MNIFIRKRLYICLFLSLLSVSAFAKTKVVVVPLLGDETKNISNIITVAKEGGDFTNPVDAINSISGESINNQYLIYIAPGVYNLSTSLVMKDFVHVQGAGSKMTEIVGAFNSTGGCNNPVVNGAISANSPGIPTSSISGITIKNTGGAGATASCGIKNGFALVHDLVVDVSGGSRSNIGISTEPGPNKFKNVEIYVRGDSGAGSTTINQGISINMYAIVEDSKIVVGGKGRCYGILTSFSSSKFKNMHINVGGATSESYGIHYTDIGSPHSSFEISRSYIRGKTAAAFLETDSDSNFVAHWSSFKGGVQTQGEGMPRCFYSDDTNTELGTDCSAPESP